MIKVIKPGFQSTVQDRGRFGFSHYGISISGTADSISYKIGNLLVGNNCGEAAIEMTLVGGEFLFEEDAIISITGSDFQPKIENKIVPMWQTLKIKSDEIISFSNTLSGARSYICIKGGINVQQILGSRSTHLLTSLGGLNGRKLLKGDRLPIEKLTNEEIQSYKVSKQIIALLNSKNIIRVTTAPQTNYFSKDVIEKFTSNKYVVSEEANRMGLRLIGKKLEREIMEEIITEGITLGAIQISNDGMPIILFVEHQTTGGYPKIANVISADMHKIGQLRPRDEINFQFVSIEQAHKLNLELESLISINSFDKL